MPERRVPKSLLIKFKKEPFKGWRSKKSEIRKDLSSWPTLKEWNQKMLWWPNKRSKESMTSWNKQQKPTPKLLLKNKREPMRKKTWSEVSSNIKETRIKKNMKLKWRPRESRRRRKEKSKDLENSKRRLLIDKLKLMLLEPRELSKKARDKPEKERDWSNRREKESRLISKLPDKDNSLKSNQTLLSKPESKERTIWIKSKSKSKLSNKKERSRRRRRRPYKITLKKLEVKYTIRSKSKNKIDLTILRRAEKSERK